MYGREANVSIMSGAQTLISLLFNPLWMFSCVRCERAHKDMETNDWWNRVDGGFVRFSENRYHQEKSKQFLMRF